MKGWNLKMGLPNHLCLVKSWLRFASQLQLAKLCFQTEIQLLINNLCKWVCYSLEILAVSSNQDIRIYKMPPYLCYRNFTLHSDCLGIVTIPENINMYPLIITQIPKILWNKAHLQHFVASSNSAFNKNFPCHRTSPVKPLESLFAAIRSWPKVWPRPLSSVHQGAWPRLYQTLAPLASFKCTFKAWLANISSSTFRVNNQGLTSE